MFVSIATVLNFFASLFDSCRGIISEGPYVSGSAKLAFDCTMFAEQYRLRIDVRAIAPPRPVSSF